MWVTAERLVDQDNRVATAPDICMMCGALNMACCAGNICQSGGVCVTGGGDAGSTCMACGGSGQRCCTGGAGGAGTCSTGFSCVESGRQRGGDVHRVRSARSAVLRIRHGRDRHVQHRPVVRKRPEHGRHLHHAVNAGRRRRPCTKSAGLDRGTTSVTRAAGRA